MSALVTAVGSLREFFKTALAEVMRTRRLAVGEPTEFYLVNLLSEFVVADKLFLEKEDGTRDHEPLAVLYHRALLQGREERLRTLRRLGDVSLYKAGFFSDALREGVVGADYYIQMGGAAYGQAAALTTRAGVADVFRELGEKFAGVVAALEELAARGMVSGGAEGTLRVYEKWVRTGSDSLERVLSEAGVAVPRKGFAN